MKNDVFTKIARVRVRLSSVCKFNLFYMVLLFIVMALKDSLAQSIFIWTFAFLFCFSIFFSLFAFVFDREDEKKKKRGTSRDRIDEMNKDLD